jgi:hypothetical protein
MKGAWHVPRPSDSIESIKSNETLITETFQYESSEHDFDLQTSLSPLDIMCVQWGGFFLLNNGIINDVFTLRPSKVVLSDNPNNRQVCVEGEGKTSRGENSSNTYYTTSGTAQWLEHSVDCNHNGPRVLSFCLERVKIDSFSSLPKRKLTAAENLLKEKRKLFERRHLKKRLEGDYAGRNNLQPSGKAGKRNAGFLAAVAAGQMGIGLGKRERKPDTSFQIFVEKQKQDDASRARRSSPVRAQHRQVESRRGFASL